MDDLYWEAQSFICELEEKRENGTASHLEGYLLDFLLTFDNAS